MTGITRRQFVVGGTLAGLMVTVGCGNDDPDAADAPAATEPAVDGRFPRTIEHKFGTTELTEVPERVVTVGLSDQDAVLALGVAPVAVTEWFGEQPFAAWPWALDALGDAQPEVLPSAEIAFERIAALQPDLILAAYGGLETKDYELLSAIAPTVAQSGDHENWTTPWQDMTRVIARALGRDDQAEELIASVEARFAAVRADHPEFAGAGGVVADGPSDATYGILAPDDPRGRVMGALGFECPAALAALVPDGLFYAEVSAEQLPLLDTDVVVWLSYGAGERAVVEAEPLYQRLALATEGRTVFLDEVQTAAMGFSTVLSLPFLIDQLVPRLVAALDGDSTTTP